MNKKKSIYRKTCPRCDTPCKLRAVSSFDLNGTKYGAMFVCPSRHWDDWGNIIDVCEIVDFYSEKSTEVITDD
jgi:hypothetical protein